ncbi:hypothetical protein HNP55_002343 [Paucibacter oligotrophus]|uniref:Outer membrane beta-barrel porin/alpha-amylase n=1 Tax=Roseateles oligotrophus TaxID=1769250 RepID=A0A840L6M7_9BURK|nr:transporter [Roseateles oligotrophus]MBB4843820.1 hypothetical protein [Roseateles oligotrophus]
MLSSSSKAMGLRWGARALLPLLLLPALARAQSADDLAKATANPIADLVSLPLQSNWDRKIGVEGGTQYTLNVQPVIPVRLGEDWNLITRSILPLQRQPALQAGQGDAWGLGDVVASQFFSPRNSGAMVWGLGPVFMLPTASKDRLGTGKWSLGPTGVMLVQSGPWTYGGLANHLVSVGGDSARSRVRATFLNPFVSYRMGQGWSATFAPEYSYNWEAASGQRETLPLIFLIAKVSTLGQQPISLSLGYKHYVKAPNEQLDNGFRLVLSFLFPKGS